MMPKHIFWPIIDCPSLYATRVTTRVQGAVLGRIVERGHFRSLDKDAWRNGRKPAIRILHGAILIYLTRVVAD